MDEAEQLLKDTFGYDAFRPLQKKIIQRLLDGKSACGIMPTGGGKSMTYQIPGLILPHLTLVISPLIALMKDQTDVLREKGLPAATLDSTIGIEESRLIKAGIRDGSLKILFVAPERLDNEGFVKSLANVTISLLAVDEAHCVSSWGNSFRSVYLKVARFAKELKAERVLCLTATATKKVAEDTCNQFGIEPEGLFMGATYRDNLHIDVRPVAREEGKISAILKDVKTREGPTIIYVTTQAQASDVCRALRGQGVEQIDFYHAGMNNDERKRVQDVFMAKSSTKPVIVATIAFGMGIDKADIRQVIHYNLPKSIEGYSQEIGRAGRDGLPSKCICLLCASDLPILEGFARGDTPSLTSIEQWLQAVGQAKTEDGGKTIFVSTYHQEREFDIRSNVLGLLFAYLDLDHGYLRATTAFYEVYDIVPRTTQATVEMQKDKSKEAQIILKHAAFGRTKSVINMVNAAEESGHSRDLLAYKITEWEVAGWITTKASQVRNRFNLLKPIPEDEEELKQLALALYEKMCNKEEDEIGRLRNVAQLLTKDQCIPFSLGQYFGDEATTIPGSKCTKCTFCKTGKSYSLGGSRAATPITDADINKILATCGIRDDARVLTRFAYGITSPRLTQLKLSTKNPLFGSMANCEFDALLQRMEEECKKAGYQNERGFDQPKPSKAAPAAKRPASSSSKAPAAKKAKR